MKDPLEVLRIKEQEVVRVKKEIAALKIAAPLLVEEGASNGDHREDKKPIVEMP